MTQSRLLGFYTKNGSKSRIYLIAIAKLNELHRLLQYGLSKQTGKLFSVEDVLRGLKCDCICPDQKCKAPLIARQGKEKQWHFAHANNAECAGARKTALHLWAQQIIQEEKQIMLPPYKGRYYKFSKPSIQFEEVFLEQRIPIEDRYIQPDCIGRITDKGIPHDLLIEILVTHEVDEKKKNDIKALNLACIEIDLSDLIDTDYTSEIIKERLLNRFNDRVWLNNPVFEKREREEQLKEEKRQQELEQQQREQARERRRKAGNFVRPFFYGENNPTNFVNQFIKQPRDFRDEIIHVLESWYYYSFFEPTDDDVNYAYQQAELIENLPNRFSLKEVFNNPLNNDTLIEYIDKRNDSDGRMFLFRTVLKRLYRQGYSARYYSDYGEYYSADETIKEKLDTYRTSTETLTLEQQKRLERYVLVYCYDRIQTNIKGDKEHLFQCIENKKYWSVLSCLFSLFLHHIVFSGLTDFVQLTEYFIENHIEYAQLYLYIARSSACETNNYISADGDDKLAKLSAAIDSSKEKRDLDKIAKFLFPEISHLYPPDYRFKDLTYDLSRNLE